VGLPPIDPTTWIRASEQDVALINGTLLGKGERTGNAPLEGVLWHMLGMGYFRERSPDFTMLNELAEL
jgi:isopropylmalate/homocitrate/citramalate synthase